MYVASFIYFNTNCYCNCLNYFIVLFLLLLELYLPEQCYDEDMAEDDNELFPTDESDRNSLISYTQPHQHQRVYDTAANNPASHTTAATIEDGANSTNTQPEDFRLTVS